jgi:DNA-binding XRE family transcriptional regulator
MGSKTTKTTKTKRDDLDAWLDARYRRDPGMRARVEARVAEMALEHDLVALRESAGVSQRTLAKRLGVSQPAIAKLESGKAKNVGVLTLARYAAALGGQVRIEITGPAARTSRTGGRARVAVRASP